MTRDYTDNMNKTATLMNLNSAVNQIDESMPIGDMFANIKSATDVLANNAAYMEELIARLNKVITKCENIEKENWKTTSKIDSKPVR